MSVFDEVDECVEAASVFAVDGFVGDLCVADEFESVDDGFGAFVVLFFVFDGLVDASVDEEAERYDDEEQDDLDGSFHCYV